MMYVRGRFAFGLVWVLASLLMLAGSAHASGWGAYFEYGHSDGNVEFEDFGELPDEFADAVEDQDFDKDLIGLGLMFDTNVAKDKLFNYRIGFGWQHTLRDGDSGDIDGNGFALSQSFGFGVLRRPNYRVWLGPVVRINFDAYDEDGADLYSVNVGAGPQLGLNYHLNDKISLTGSFAYQYMYAAEFLDAGDESEPLTGSEHLVTLRVGFLYRGAKDLFDGGKD